MIKGDSKEFIRKSGKEEKTPLLTKCTRRLTDFQRVLVAPVRPVCYNQTENRRSGFATLRLGGNNESRRQNSAVKKKEGDFSGGAGGQDRGFPAGRFQMGKRSFPKLKIPHQSHADFCSTDTAGGLDNKKRRYAPRGGVAYRLFLWGFPKGATPPFGTRLCEAKCSVLYALSALP